MKRSNSQSDSPGTNEIRLHNVYKALSSPHSSTSKRYLKSLASAPSTTIDQLLCKISSHARKTRPTTSNPSATVEKAPSEEWPLHRLLACFEAILCSMKSRSSQDDLLPLRSFKVCFRLVLDTFSADSNATDDISDATKAHAAKCWYKLLDHLARLTQQTSGTKVTGLVKAILSDIRSRQAHLHILDWATDVTEKDMSPHLELATDGRTLLKARSYGLRGLFTQASFFGVDLIVHNAYHRLLHQNLFYYSGFSITAEHIRTTASGKRRRLGHTTTATATTTAQFSLCLASSQLLDALCKVEEDQQDSFDSTESRHHLWNNIGQALSTVLARTWTGALMDLLELNNNNDNTTTSTGHNGMVDKGRPFYYLTTALVKLPPDSPVYLHLESFPGSYTLTQGLSTFFAQLVYSIQQPQSSGGAKTKIDSPARGLSRAGMQSDGLRSVYTMDVLIKLLTRLCHLSWRIILPHLNVETGTIFTVSIQMFGKQMTRCLTNFLLAFTACPVSVETLVTLASNSDLLSTDLCADVVIRGYFGLDSTLLQHCQPLLSPLLETLMQYIQVVPDEWRTEIGPRIAWCLRSQMALLYGDNNKLDDSVLLPKYEKLVVYLLHDEGAVKQLAESSTGLGNYIWEPTILHVRLGLEAAASLTSSTTIDPSHEQTQALKKAKRALVALEKVSHHPRACERLVETTVLELIDPSLIPCVGFPSVVGGSSLQMPIEVWSVYGLLVRLLASLAGRTSLLRSKLLHERQLIGVVMGLLWRALRYESILIAQDILITLKQVNVCQDLVSSSLQVVYAYRYDSTATLEWLQWKQQDDTGASLTLVAALLSTLVPWRGLLDGKWRNIAHSWCLVLGGQIDNALILLEHLAPIESCGKQMIQENGDDLNNLSQMLVDLSHPLLSYRINPSNNTIVPIFQPLDEDPSVGGGTSLTTGNDSCDTQPTDDDDTQRPLLVEFDGTDTTPASCDRIDKEKSDNVSPDDGDNNSVHNPEPEIHHSYVNQENYIEATLRILTKVIMNGANLKLMILNDSFTRLFAPLIMLDDPKSWPYSTKDPRSIAARLGTTLWTRVDELGRLFQFFGQNEDDVNHRHELTAVALVYTSFWDTTHWHSTLGLFSFDTTKESIVYSTCPFGILCHMLMFDDTGRRHTAAQALATLALSLKSTWQHDLDQGLEENKQQQQGASLSSTTGEKEGEVVIRTNDSPTPLRVRAQDLTWASPVFQAMLSDRYLESSTDSIYLHDITMAGLEHFIHVSQWLQKKCAAGGCHAYDVDDQLVGGWDQVMALIHMADRYGCMTIQLLGERWIMQKIKKRHPGYLSGCLATYLYLRDKYHTQDGGGLTCKTWPFHRVLNQCVKAMLLDVTHLVDDPAFKDLIRIDADATHLDAIETFCNAALVLFQHTPLD
ncbi:hypothetical protein [Absidia glauca]|uniref:BTB domain-containing protein n=1 Tax=Absidia glauca TaxID=4829 RepID=A0A168SR81_ABSGL|nr:hypothetical protein [Absidia glauca]